MLFDTSSLGQTSALINLPINEQTSHARDSTSRRGSPDAYGETSVRIKKVEAEFQRRAAKFNAECPGVGERSQPAKFQACKAEKTWLTQEDNRLHGGRWACTACKTWRTKPLLASNSRIKPPNATDGHRFLLFLQAQTRVHDRSVQYAIPAVSLLRSEPPLSATNGPEQLQQILPAKPAPLRVKHITIHHIVAGCFWQGR